mgnify:CR=1 FL=1
MARSRDCKSIRYDSAIDGHCAACSSANLRQASSNRRSMSRGWLAERTGTTRPRRRRRAVRHMPYLPHRTHQLALRARRGSQQERHRLSAGPQRKPSSSFFSRDARQCAGRRDTRTIHHRKLARGAHSGAGGEINIYPRMYEKGAACARSAVDIWGSARASLIVTVRRNSYIPYRSASHNRTPAPT